MSDSATVSNPIGSPRPRAVIDALPPRRTYLQQVVRDTVKPTMARLGMGWVGILMFLACFAPYLANSHPISMTVDGRWSSPMYLHLAAVDVVLPVAFITAAVLLLTRRLSLGRGMALVAWTASVTLLIAAPPALYQEYKEIGGRSGAWAGFLKGLFDAYIMYSIGIILYLGVVAAAVLFPIYVLPRRATIVAALCLSPLAILLVMFPLKPPANVVYEHYRVIEMQERTRTARVDAEWVRIASASRWVTGSDGNGAARFAEGLLRINAAFGEPRVQSMKRTIIPYSPTDRINDEREARLNPPSLTHWVGTDNYSQDLASRVIHATRIALSIGFISTGLSVTIGIIIGGMMGYFAGWVDLIGMRLMEILEAVPPLVLLITFTASRGVNLYMMMALLGILRWTGNARFIRAEFLRLRKQDFVQAAIASGLPLRSVLFRHMLPNGISPVLVSASFGVASAILLEATLSFLGLGLVDAASWGEMLNQARAGGAGFNWWIAMTPGVLIFLTVFSYNLVGEAIRDALDPKLLKRDS